MVYYLEVVLGHVLACMFPCQLHVHVVTYSCVFVKIDTDGLLDGPAHSDTPIDVLTPNQSKPSAIHLLDDDEDDEDRSWRR